MISPLSRDGRLMVFVDGSNLLIELSKAIGISFRADKPPLTALSLARHMIDATITYYITSEGQPRLINIRRFWFASYQGDEQLHRQLSITLRENRFEPVLFKKRNGKEKGVDVSLTKEMLVNAFNQNFDLAFLFAGDADYVGLVNEVKRYGPVVNGAFFRHGLSEALQLAFDSFLYLDPERMNQEELSRHTGKIQSEVA
jgi:uncharacterized LabA/DUF88 family protein